MCEIRQGCAFVIVDKVTSEFSSITTGRWRSCADDSHRTFTLTYIYDTWNLVYLVLGYSKMPGTTTGVDLVRSSEGFVNDHDLKGRMVAGVTD